MIAGASESVQTAVNVSPSAEIAVDVLGEIEFDHSGLVYPAEHVIVGVVTLHVPDC